MSYTWPAVKGTQKTTMYYLANLPYGAIDRLVVLPEDELGRHLLKGEDDMQRKLSWSRVRKEMKRYLLDQDDSFYSALTLFILPRDLGRAEEGEDFAFQAAAVPLPVPLLGQADSNGEIGILAISDGAVLFPGDGQHRAASIKEALRDEPDLAGVLVPVVLIPFAGADQVRQLFADLNLNAKPVNKTIGLAFETRDPIAVISRQVAEQVPLFKDRVNVRTNSLPKSSANVIALNTLVEGNKALREALPGGDASATELAEVWEAIIDALPGWDDVLAGEVTPGEVREDFVHAHGIGWQALALAAAAVIKSDAEAWHDLLTEALENIDWRRTNPDWQGVAMVGERMNNTGPGIRATAGYILDRAGFTQADPAAAGLLATYQASLAKAAAPAEEDLLLVTAG